MAAKTSNFPKAIDFSMTKLQTDFLLKANQEKAIKTVCLEGKDCICVLPTGYGKSVIYQSRSSAFAPRGRE